MSERLERVSSLLTELTASYIQHEANTDPMITVTHVTVSPDLKNATIFFTTIPDGREEDALAFLKRSGRDIRGFVKKKANLKHIPHFEFAVDYGERHRQHMDEVVRKIENKDF